MKRDDPVLALLSYVPPELLQVHDQLINWSRWARVSRIKRGHCASMEWRYLPERLTEETQEERQIVHIPPDELAALPVEKAVIGCPERNRRYLILHYIHRLDPNIIKREVHVRWGDMPSLLNDSRRMVKNKLHSIKRCV